MKLHAISGLTWGCPYYAVGMQRALELAIGLPSRSTSASWMLLFLMPAEVRRSLKMPPKNRAHARDPAPRARSRAMRLEGFEPPTRGLEGRRSSSELQAPAGRVPPRSLGS